MFNEPYYAPPLEPPEGYYFETREQSAARREAERLRELEEDEDDE